MDKTEKVADIVIEDVYNLKGEPSKEKLAPYVRIWTDEGLKDTISKTEGVEACYQDVKATRYLVYFDKRYDRNTVKYNIKNAVMSAIHGQPTPTTPPPPLDISKAKSLIEQLINETLLWGMYTATLSDCNINDPKRYYIQLIASGASVMCNKTKTQLEQMLEDSQLPSQKEQKI